MLQMRRLIALTAALAMLVFAPSALAAHRSVPSSFMGMNWDEEIAFQAPWRVENAEFARMASAGVESVRASFLWSAAQPEQGGPFDFTRTDTLVELASAHHLTLLPIVISAPPWARAFDADFSPPDNPEDYAAYLTALIRRYGPHGSFWRAHPHLPKMAINAWQIWNEPGLQYQWSTPAMEDYAIRYANLLRVSYQAVKAADRHAQVVLAGLANNSPGFLAHLYSYGIKGYFDIAAVHPYTQTAAGVYQLVREARAVMRRNGDRHKTIWVTELGLPASKGIASSSNSVQTTSAGMAHFLTLAYHYLTQTRRRLGIGRVYWYTWASSYSPNAGVAIFDFSGLVKWVPGAGMHAPAVPAYAAYIRAARRYEGCVKTATARCR